MMESSNWPRSLSRAERIDRSERILAAVRRDFEAKPNPVRQAAVRMAEFAVALNRAIR